MSTAASRRHLRAVVSVPLNPGQELAELNAGPMFSDEYIELIRELEPSDDDQDRMLVLESLQDELESEYLEAWCRMAVRLSDQIGVEIHVCDPEYLPAQSLRSPDPRVARIRSSISHLISIEGCSDTWAVKANGNPSYTDLDTTHAESSRS